MEQTLLPGTLRARLVTSVSGMNKGEILAHTEWKQKLASAVGEACAVAKAGGAEVNPPKLQAIFDSMPPGMRSSMQKDLAAKAARVGCHCRSHYARRGTLRHRCLHHGRPGCRHSLCRLPRITPEGASLANTLADRRINSLQQNFQSLI